MRLPAPLKLPDISRAVIQVERKGFGRREQGKMLDYLLFCILWQTLFSPLLFSSPLLLPPWTVLAGKASWMNPLKVQSKHFHASIIRACLPARRCMSEMQVPFSTNYCYSYYPIPLSPEPCQLTCQDSRWIWNLKSQKKSNAYYFSE